MAARSAAVATRVDVPLWAVCPAAHWRRCADRGDYRPPARSRAGGQAIFRVALHGDVGQMALERFGACRAGLVAIALDPRRLPNSGRDTSVLVDLSAAGRPMLRIDCDVVPLEAIVCVERLAPLPDAAGYHEPALQTAGDRERRRNRDGRRRTA